VARALLAREIMRLTSIAAALVVSVASGDPAPAAAPEPGLDVIGQGLGALGFASLPRVPMPSQEGARRRRRARSGADDQTLGSLLSCLTSAFSAA
jgi:hypothetical protein